MSYSLVFHPKAEKEFLEAITWYEGEQENLGKRFKQAIDDKIGKILQSPEIYPKSIKDYKQAVVEDFPYVIIYRMRSNINVIYVSAVYHTSRNPRKKYRK